MAHVLIEIRVKHDAHRAIACTKIGVVLPVLTVAAALLSARSRLQAGGR